MPPCILLVAAGCFGIRPGTDLKHVGHTYTGLWKAVQQAASCFHHCCSRLHIALDKVVQERLHIQNPWISSCNDQTQRTALRLWRWSCRLRCNHALNVLQHEHQLCLTSRAASCLKLLGSQGCQVSHTQTNLTSTKQTGVLRH